MNDAQNRILRTLAIAGGWLSRADLSAELDYSEQRVDDELADLVTESTVLYNPRGREYRLGYTALARKALQRLLVTKAPRVILGAEDRKTGTFRFGVAVRARNFTGDDTLAVAELEMPFDPTDPARLQALGEAFARFDRRMGEREGTEFPRPAFVRATAEGQQP